MWTTPPTWKYSPVLQEYRGDLRVPSNLTRSLCKPEERKEALIWREKAVSLQMAKAGASGKALLWGGLPE